MSSAFFATVAAGTFDAVHFAVGGAATAVPGFAPAGTFGAAVDGVLLFGEDFVVVSNGLFGVAGLEAEGLVTGGTAGLVVELFGADVDGMLFA